MRAALLAFLLLASPTLWAQATVDPVPAPAATSAVTLETVTVSGEQPGPGLWKVSKGDHVLLILGTLEPLPANMQWRSTEVEQAIAQSQAMLKAPSLKVTANTGFFGKLFLLPSLIGVRDDPDDRTLAQVVSADDYARWLVLKAKYIGRDRDVEHYRPIFAALELYEKAFKKIGLKRSGGISEQVQQLAKQHAVPLIPVRYTVTIEEPRKAIKTFKASPIDDVGCFHQAIENVDKRLDTLAERANAWAVGDLEKLHGVIEADNVQLCLDAVTQAGFARQLGLADAPARVNATWLAAAEDALTKNRQTFALLPMEELLSSKGLVSQLRARGYKVSAPDDDEETK